MRFEGKRLLRLVRRMTAFLDPPAKSDGEWDRTGS